MSKMLKNDNEFLCSLIEFKSEQFKFVWSSLLAYKIAGTLAADNETKIIPIIIEIETISLYIQHLVLRPLSDDLLMPMIKSHSKNPKIKILNIIPFCKKVYLWLHLKNL